MSRGGRRAGSGRPAVYAKTTQEMSLDVRALQRGSYLSSRQCITWPWPSEANIVIATDLDSVRLTYRYKIWRGEQRDVDQQIVIQRTQCYYGGSRAWFTCPVCERRAAILYLSEIPICRICSRLVYRSQAEDDLARNWRRNRKMRVRLGQAEGDPWKLPPRPKGMHQATYSRLRLDWTRETLQRAEMIKKLLTPR